MTDEKYAFIEDVIDRGSTARQRGCLYKHAGKNSACELPSDHLSKKEREKLNGDMISININRPVSYSVFLKASDDTQRDILMKMIDNGATLERIGRLWNVDAAKSKFLLNKYCVNVPKHNRYKKTEWELFIKEDTPEESTVHNEHSGHNEGPIEYTVFKSLSKDGQIEYLKALREKRMFTNKQIASMWKVSIAYISRLCREYGVANPKNKASDDAFREWRCEIVEEAIPEVAPVVEEAIHEVAPVAEEAIPEVAPVAEEAAEDIGGVSILQVSLKGSAKDIAEYITSLGGNWKITMERI